MNPLTQVKRTQQINLKEAALGIGDDASWHAKFKESPYVYAGSLPFDLTEGDLLAVFSQYGEIVDVNLVRDKGTGKSKGFAFVAYEDQRSTVLAVDNLNGANILGRTIRVDHVSNYKKKQEEDEAMEQQKREERGVCRAFQRGNCNRGDACKFSHNEQRAANTGWGAKEDNVKWGDEIPPVGNVSGRMQESHDKGKRWSRVDDDEKGRKSHARRDEEKEANYRGDRDRDERPVKHGSRRDERYRKEEISGRHDSESNTKRKLRDDRSTRQESESNAKENRDKKGRREVDYDREKRPRYDEDSSSRRHKEEERR